MSSEALGQHPVKEFAERHLATAVGVHFLPVTVQDGCGDVSGILHLQNLHDDKNELSLADFGTAVSVKFVEHRTVTFHLR